MKMRSSYSLTLVALLANLAYGFSAPPRVQPRLEPFRFAAPAADSVSKKPSATVPASSAFSAPRSSPVRPFRGGARRAASKSGPIDAGSKCPVTGAAAVFGSLYGTFGVVYILAKAIKRVLPIALEPFQAGAVPLTPLQLGAYIITCLGFAYAEGYKGFQLRFAPLVVARSFTLVPGKNGTRWYHFLLAPNYSMGMIHATRKRRITSFSVALGVAAIVAGVKRLPYPWRNVVDAGVAVGLSWGGLSILALYLRSWATGQPPRGVDVALPPAK